MFCFYLRTLMRGAAVKCLSVLTLRSISDAERAREACRSFSNQQLAQMHSVTEEEGNKMKRGERQ